MGFNNEEFRVSKCAALLAKDGKFSADEIVRKIWAAFWSGKIGFKYKTLTKKYRFSIVMNTDIHDKNIAKVKLPAIVISKDDGNIKPLYFRVYDESSIRCDLCLMSALPQDGMPIKGKMYLEKIKCKLKYVTLNPKWKKVEGELDIAIDGDLNIDILNRNKSDILEITSNRGHTQWGASVNIEIPDDFDVKELIKKLTEFTNKLILSSEDPIIPYLIFRKHCFLEPFEKDIPEYKTLGKEKVLHLIQNDPSLSCYLENPITLLDEEKDIWSTMSEIDSAKFSERQITPLNIELNKDSTFSHIVDPLIHVEGRQDVLQYIEDEILSTTKSDNALPADKAGTEAARVLAQQKHRKGAVKLADNKKKAKDDFWRIKNTAIGKKKDGSPKCPSDNKVAETIYSKDKYGVSYKTFRFKWIPEFKQEKKKTPSDTR